MMGAETEYGILDGWTLEKAMAVQMEVRKNRRFLESTKSGVYLDNGARVYVDQGKQNEYSTPETHSPSDLVVCELAGRRLMAEAARAVGLQMLCTNTDPANGTTWGTHENYECERDQRDFPRAKLYAHLVTRIIYTGAGGLDPCHPGVSLVLSPRACTIRSGFSYQGVPLKTLVFAKPDAYCKGSRLHVFCGESLLCDSASYLKYATTALVSRCLDQGISIGPGIFSESPVRVLRRLNRDLSMGLRIPLTNGRRMTALEIQASLLDGVEAHLADLPDWAPLAASRWRAVLKCLARADPSCPRQIDWLLYRQLIDELAQSYGYRGDDVRQLNRAVACGLAIPGAEAFRTFRAAANALYVRLHILGAGSVYDALAAGGAEDDARLPEINEHAIQQAMLEPPPGGRAANRAALVRRYHEKACCYASWDALHDRLNGRTLQVSEKGGQERQELWQEGEDARFDADGLASSLFRRGNYEAVIRVLRPIFEAGDSHRKRDLYSDLLLSCARSGRKEEVLATLAAHGDTLFSGPWSEAVFRLFCTVNFGLCAPVADMEGLLQTCGRLSAVSDGSFIASGSYEAFIIEQNQCVVLARRGDLTGAERLCRELLQADGNKLRTRMMARTRCHLANALYLQGRIEEANGVLRYAIGAHAGERMWWDLAEHSLPLLAKISPNPEGIREALAQAEDLHRQQRNPLGLAKILCLKARRLKEPAGFDEVRRLCSETSALRDCPVAAKVVSGWGEWTQGPSAENGPDDYWGL